MSGEHERVSETSNNYIGGRRVCRIHRPNERLSLLIANRQRISFQCGSDDDVGGVVWVVLRLKENDSNFLCRCIIALRSIERNLIELYLEGESD